MFEVICPQCERVVSGSNQDEAMKEYSFHWLTLHEDQEEMGS